MIHHGERGEQADALMPIVRFGGNMEPCSVFKIFCFTTNISSLTWMACALCACQIAWVPSSNTCRNLDQCARIQVHLGKTQMWNRGNHVPPSCQKMQEVAARVDPQARIWRNEGPQQGVRCWASQLATRTSSKLSFGPPPITIQPRVFHPAFGDLS